MGESPPIPLTPPRRRRAVRTGVVDDAAAARPKVKKLRVALVLAGLSTLALISTIFGMMMAVAHELPSLEAKAQLRAAVNSTLLDSGGHQIAKLTGNENRILDADSDISPFIRNAVIAVEDRRFYEHQGVDLRGIGRAVVQDVIRQHSQQGASTITEQFVKNALVAQKNRTVFEKLREAALAYHLERRWSKQKILTQYLNTVYFGNGAYGVESAVRTYFGGAGRHYGQSDHVAGNVSPDQAALLAGMIASPSAYDPLQNPVRSRERRDLVLRDMLAQKSITRAEYDTALTQAIPSHEQVAAPHPDSDQPYFSTWVTQQLVDRYGSGRVFGGGLQVTTSLDPQMQRAAEQAINGRLGGVGPGASLVAIDNRTGAVRAMVGGTDFQKVPFNLATNGHRQPGSAIKAFTLAAALESGISPDSVWASQPEVFHIPGGGQFVVKNFQNIYNGSTTLTDATAHSDNAVYAAVGLKVGTRRIARVAEQMGIRTPVSTNPAMVLGGLKEGLTPLEMAYAYSTIANHGRRVSGSMAASRMGPVAITKVRDGGHTESNELQSQRVLPWGVAEQMRQILRGVVLNGTGTAAQVGDFSAGKTGTTENYGDAWFVGFTDKLTVAVWVGYPNKLRSMTNDYHGGPVEGGTYPAEIWHDFVTQAISLDQSRHPNRPAANGSASSQGPSAAPMSVSPQSHPQASAPPVSRGPAAPTTQPRTQAAPSPSAPRVQHVAPAPPPQAPQPPPSQQAPAAPAPNGGASSRGGGTAASPGR
ncbi:MAG: PBP1A family penicillin-binding protein [Thermoleophilaceae bacterium]